MNTLSRAVLLPETALSLLVVIGFLLVLLLGVAVGMLAMVARDVRRLAYRRPYVPPLIPPLSVWWNAALENHLRKRREARLAEKERARRLHRNPTLPSHRG
jgi:hypothetical protein